MALISWAISLILQQALRLAEQHDATPSRSKLTRLYEQYHRQLRAYRSGWIGRSTILREAQDGAQAYLKPTAIDRVA